MTHKILHSVSTHIRNFATIVSVGLPIALASISANAQSMEYVVFSIKGNVKGLSLGQVLMEGDRFDIPAGTTVKMLGKDGSIQPITGPQSGTVTKEFDNEKGEAALQRVSSKLFNNKQFVSVLGGTRTASHNNDIDALFSGKTAQDAWLPKLSQVDVYCLRSTQPLLQVGTAHEIKKYSLLNIMRKEEITVSLGKAGVMDLTEYLAPTVFKASLKIEGRLKPITIKLMDAEDRSTLEQAAWLADNGCHQQSLRLLASF